MVAPGDQDEQDDIVSTSNDLYIYDEKFRESVSVLSIPYRSVVNPGYSGINF